METRVFLKYFVRGCSKNDNLNTAMTFSKKYIEGFHLLLKMKVFKKSFINKLELFTNFKVKFNVIWNT